MSAYRLTIPSNIRSSPTFPMPTLSLESTTFQDGRLILTPTPDTRPKRRPLIALFPTGRRDRRTLRITSHFIRLIEAAWPPAFMGRRWAIAERKNAFNRALRLSCYATHTARSFMPPAYFTQKTHCAISANLKPSTTSYLPGYAVRRECHFRD